MKLFVLWLAYADFSILFTENKGHSDIKHLMLSLQFILVNLFSCRLTDIKSNFVIALNEEYIEPTGDLTLKSGDVLAIIPPISGG